MQRRVIVSHTIPEGCLDTEVSLLEVPVNVERTVNPRRGSDMVAAG